MRLPILLILFLFQILFLPAQNGMSPCEVATSLLETVVDEASQGGDVKVSLQTLRVVEIERDHLTGRKMLEEFMSWEDSWEEGSGLDMVQTYLKEREAVDEVKRYRCRKLRPRRSGKYYQVKLTELWPGIWKADLEYYEQKEAGGWGEELIYVLDEDGKWHEAFQFFWERAD